MNRPDLLTLVLLAMIPILLGVPAILGCWRRALSKWAAIAISTVSSPFLMLGAGKLVIKHHWAVYHDPNGGSCAGGECGAAGYAAGYWPILVGMFLADGFLASFFISWIVVALLRSSRS